MRDIAVVMRTFNRHESTTPLGAGFTRQNYVKETLEAMVRSHVFESPVLHSFSICDSGTQNPSFFEAEIEGALAGKPFGLYWPGKWLTSNENAGVALRIGADSGAPWVLFCEDDIDVCDYFLDSVWAWLCKHAHVKRRLYTFGSNNSDFRGSELNDVSISSFFGTTCYAVRREDAASMSDYIKGKPLYTGSQNDVEKPGVTVAHDLHFHEWAKLAYPEIGHFAASVPSFVQHMGNASALSARDNIIRYASWPGRGWRYNG